MLNTMRSHKATVPKQALVLATPTRSLRHRLSHRFLRFSSQ